jgi:hypothetical protein
VRAAGGKNNSESLPEILIASFAAPLLQVKRCSSPTIRRRCKSSANWLWANLRGGFTMPVSGWGFGAVPVIRAFRSRLAGWGSRFATLRCSIADLPMTAGWPRSVSWRHLLLKIPSR